MALSGCYASTEILVPSLTFITLVCPSGMHKFGLRVLMWIVCSSCDAVFAPSVVENVVVGGLTDAKVVVVFRLMEWIESGCGPRAVRLEGSSEDKEASTCRGVVLVLELRSCGQ